MTPLYRTAVRLYEDTPSGLPHEAKPGIAQPEYYVYQVRQHYTSSPYIYAVSGHAIPFFATDKEAREWLDTVAAFPGDVIRIVADNYGEPSSITAGVTYTKITGHKEYHEARTRTQGLQTEWPKMRNLTEERYAEWLKKHKEESAALFAA